MLPTLRVIGPTAAARLLIEGRGNLSQTEKVIARMWNPATQLPYASLRSLHQLRDTSRRSRDFRTLEGTGCGAAGGTRFASTRNEMLDVRSQTQVRGRARAHEYRWGIVDVLLGVLMLPFGIWLMVIEGMVRAVAASRRS